VLGRAVADLLFMLHKRSFEDGGRSVNTSFFFVSQGSKVARSVNNVLL